MTHPDWLVWSIIGAMAVGTYLIRFSFIGLLGGRELPEWVLRALRYTSVGVLPGLVAPLVVFPEATGGTLDPARLLATVATLAIGLTTKNVLYAVVGGLATLYAGLALFG